MGGERGERKKEVTVISRLKPGEKIVASRDILAPPGETGYEIMRVGLDGTPIEIVDFVMGPTDIKKIVREWTERLSGGEVIEMER